MYIRKTPILEPGYVYIFPNYRHADRDDGLGLPSLSPMSIGPINHGQPGLPPALSLENFHQGNKVMEDEIDAQGKILSAFYTAQLSMYTDKVPHRHRPKTQDKKTVCSAWRTDEGVHTLSYVESRQFYCHFYEAAVKEHPDFQRLKELLTAGYNLMICGYDGYMPEKSLEDHYLDPSKPFGHELVLYSMIKGETPWRKYCSLI